MAKTEMKTLWIISVFLVYLIQDVRTREGEVEVGGRRRKRGEGGAEGGGNENKPEHTAYSSFIPDLFASYTVSTKFPGRTVAACLSEDSQHTLTSHLIPANSSTPIFNIRYKGMHTLRWKLLDDAKSGGSGRGVVCVSSGALLYPVSFPLMSWRAPLVSEYLSYTISVGEDLRVRLRGGVPGSDVWWQKEPLALGRWKRATLTNDGALLLSATMLSGSGFYTVRNDSNVDDIVSGLFGTFSLVVRECPAQRYGEDCLDWCPDCMHGGVCHPKSGVCVCQEGVMGRLCEKSCKIEMSGRDCDRKVYLMSGRQECRPSPVPCRCVPGFTGPRCLKDCSPGRWGANCEQDCSLHCVGDCNKYTGDCDAEGQLQCAGGDVGLPRLRQAPRVTQIGAQEATIVFSKWREGYDDGNATLWDTLIHVVRLRAVNGTHNLSENITTSGTRHKLTGLTPATQYEVKVVVVVEATRSGRNVTCVADGSGRERVHNVIFTTSCPKDIPVPEIVDILKTSDTSILVRWKPVSYPSACHLKYHLSVIPKGQSEEITASETRNMTTTVTQIVVQELVADVQYAIHVSASSTTSSSATTSSSLQIHPKSVGYAEVGGSVAVVVLLTVGIVLMLWRRGKRKSRRRSRQPQPENAAFTPVSAEGDT